MIFMLYGCTKQDGGGSTSPMDEGSGAGSGTSPGTSSGTSPDTSPDASPGTTPLTPATTPPATADGRARLPRPVGDGATGAGDNLPIPEPKTYKAEEAGIYGSLVLMNDGAVGRFEQSDRNDKLEFTVRIEQEGFYELSFDTKTFGGFKENYLVVNGVPAGAFSIDSADYAPAIVSKVYLEAGDNTVAITAHWGWIAVRSLTVSGEAPSDGTVYNVPISLINPNADDNALGLMSFLAMNYGKVSLAGQQSQGDWKLDHGLFGGEAGFVYDKTGKRPAVIGLDVIDYSLSRVERGARSYEIEAAIEAWENNAIVTFCWHWNAPSPYITGTWYSAFYTDHCLDNRF